MSPECEKYRESLPLALDGGLPRKEHREAAAHLIGCPACLAEARALTRSWELFEAEQAAPPLPHKLRAWRPAPERVRPFFWRLGLAAAAAAIAMAVMPGREPEPVSGDWDRALAGPAALPVAPIAAEGPHGLQAPPVTGSGEARLSVPPKAGPKTGLSAQPFPGELRGAEPMTPPPLKIKGAKSAGRTV